MSTSTSKENKDSIPEMIPLGIAIDYPVQWDIHHIIRDFVQNFYDSIGVENFANEFKYDIYLNTPDYPCGNKTLDVKMSTFGHPFSYHWLTCIGGSTKTGKNGYAGKYGEGFKIAMLCLLKLGGNAVMASSDWELRPCVYTETVDGHDVLMLGYQMSEHEDDGFTTLELSGILASEENIRYVREATAEFIYPQNVLLADKIEEAETYGVYARSDVEVPCHNTLRVPGIFYYKHIARGRLPFPAVIHTTDELEYFDSDRSRNLLPESSVVDAVYRIATHLASEASFWLLMQMKQQWQDLPTFKDHMQADLKTWYYVVCQLVRNISTDPELVKRFAQECPLEKYAYLERPGGDKDRNQLINEAKRWFVQVNTGQDRRTLINPIFRLLGVSSVLSEYQERKNTLYRELTAEENIRAELLYACARITLYPFSDKLSIPKILIYTGEQKRVDQKYLQYGILPSAEARVSHTFYGNEIKQHVKYQISEVMLVPGDLSAEADFKQVLLKYIVACLNAYGTERSGYPNTVLTYVGGYLYKFRSVVKKYEEKWSRET